MFEIGVDIGGTNIKYGLVNEALEIVAHGSIRTIFRIYARVCNICPIIRHHDRRIRIIPYFGIRVNRIRIHLFVEVIKVRHTRNSACLSDTQEEQFQKQFMG